MIGLEGWPWGSPQIYFITLWSHHYHNMFSLSCALQSAVEKVGERRHDGGPALSGFESEEVGCLCAYMCVCVCVCP